MLDEELDVRDRQAGPTSSRAEPCGAAAPTMMAAVSAQVGGGALQRKLQRRLLQRRGAGGGVRDEEAHEAAARGTSGAGSALPYREAIQRSFGRHDVSRVVAHTDAKAAEGARAMGALAFASGDHVAFGAAPDLHTAAHEAAHVVQQRGGVSLKGGVGEAGDPHEQHADRVADCVVAGQSSEALLDQVATPSAAAPAGGQIQRILDKEFSDRLKEEHGYHGPENGQYMQWGPPSDQHVDWKAHVGVRRADRQQAFERVSPVLKQLAVGHKFDADDAPLLPKFLTIYPPEHQEEWAPILARVEGALGGLATVMEESTKAVGGAGKIGMRHGQITALTFEMLEQEGIALTKTEEALLGNTPVHYYAVNDHQKVWEGQPGRLAWVPSMKAFFFLLGGQQRPQTAILWQGRLRSDPRSEWNPFNTPLPGGVVTTEEIAGRFDGIGHRLHSIEQRLDLSRNRVGSLAHDEERMLLETDGVVIGERQRKQSQEIHRLTGLRTELALLTPELDRLGEVGVADRKDQLRLRIEAHTAEIGRLIRQLEIMF